MKLLWIAVLLAACSRTRPPEHGPAGPLRLMTYNVNFGLAGDPDGVAAIRSGDADLVLLQETNAGWEAALRRELGARYPHMAFHHCCRAGGLGVLSRWPFRVVETIPAPDTFPAWRVVVDAPSGRLQVLDVHLRPPMSDDGSWVKGFFTTGANRLREVTEYARHLEPGLPTLIVGDFNEEPGGQASAYLTRAGFRDAVADTLPGQPTWHWPVAGVELRMQLDHVMHDARWRVVGAQVLPAGGSDHYPVVVELAGVGGG